MSKPFALIRFSGETKSRLYTGNEVRYEQTHDATKKYFVLHAFDENKTPNLAFECEDEYPFKDKLPADLKLEFLEDENQFFYTKELYESLVNNAIDEIKSGTLQKVVHGRASKVNAEKDVLKKFKELELKFTESTVFLIYFPGKTCWIGATPELFVSWKDGIAKTVALAGTSLISEQPIPGEKELDEQQIIVSYFKEIFAQQKISEFKIGDTEVLQVGNLAHWQSKIEFYCKKEQLPELLKQLHPTPAVGGFPKSLALDYLLKNEKTNRGYYSGYFGLFNPREVKLYVNLRCMNIFKNASVAFAGGGITSESIAKLEWDETLWKLNSI